MSNYKVKIFLSFLFVVLSWGVSYAQTAFEFKGRIGKYPVVMSLYGYVSGVEGDIYYVSQGKNKELQLTGVFISELDSSQLVWRFVETVNGKYNGVYYVVWNYFIGKSSDIVGAYINSKGDEYEVILKCTSHESLRESDGY